MSDEKAPRTQELERQIRALEIRVGRLNTYLRVAKWGIGGLATCEIAPVGYALSQDDPTKRDIALGAALGWGISVVLIFLAIPHPQWHRELERCDILRRRLQAELRSQQPHIPQLLAHSPRFAFSTPATSSTGDMKQPLLPGQVEKEEEQAEPNDNLTV